MNNIILVDTSYTNFHRFYATLRWYSFANKEEYKEDYSTYKNTPLYQLKQECSIKIDNNYKLQEKIKMAVDNLVQLDGVSEATAQVLVQAGIMSVVDLSASESDDIQKIVICSPEDAASHVKAATEAIENEEIANEPGEESEIVSASAVPSQRMGLIRDGGDKGENEADKFSEAEKRLREELAAFKLK